MTVTTIHYDPTESDFDVPAGTYAVRFEGVVDKKPFENSAYTKPGQPPEPRWGWRFLVLEGDQKGKTIEQETGRKATKKSKLAYLLNLLLAGDLKAGQNVEVEALIGRTYRLTWAVNPDSPKGNCHVSHLLPLAAPTANGSAPGPAPGPTPADSDTPPTQTFWVEVDGEVVKRDRAAVADLLESTQRSAATLMLCPVGSKTWALASDLGFADPVPF
jgi:hypothetical protein